MPRRPGSPSATRAATDGAACLARPTTIRPTAPLVEWRHLALNGPALAVITRAVELLFYPQPTTRESRELLPQLVRKDPEMLDSTLGLLFRYDPS